MDKTEKKQLAILRVLQNSPRPISSAKITEQMKGLGYEVSERTIRYYLKEMDLLGFTEKVGRKGRRITELGHKEVGTAHVFEKVGFLAAKIDRLTYQMTFDLRCKSGTVIINASILRQDQIRRAAPLMSRVFSTGYSMGNLLTVFPPGEKIGELTVPPAMIGIGTVCSITLNGVLLAHGIPTASRFGGLLELVNHKPTRFVEIITYEGTSIDPLEIFIQSGMTDCRGAVSSGTGRIGVGFREIPMEARERVIELAAECEKAGLGGFLAIGWPGQDLLDVPVSEGRVGVIVIGGLNPTAIMAETDIKVQSHALAALIPCENLFPYHQLEARLDEMGL